ncbi:protein bunched, class 2/F/G isoform isoform X3 [Ceratitis capitata]|uniref:protein bunched, class 2/F/G isoform isoform X3 n=1 Tax=Ceratitis capitata TaxID=7213 RepID=UPI0006189757|nr:protein bunched, class 2/F/G isoform isoform X3 [Ceratitis capitata]
MASLVGEQQISSNNQEAEPVQKIESREGSVERKANFALNLYAVCPSNIMDCANTNTTTLHWFAQVGGDDSEAQVCKDRDEKLKLARERQNEERQRKIEELKAQAEAAQRYREQKEEERRRRIEEIRQRDSEKRHQVEERKRAITEAEKERREYILRKNQERESRLETKKSSRSTVAFAFGSSTPRLLEPDFGLVSPSTYLGHRRSTSITNVTGASLSRRSSERELTDSGAKKRATSAGGTDRHEDHRRKSSSMYEVFNWGYSNDEPPKRFSLSIVGSEINIDDPPTATVASATAGNTRTYAAHHHHHQYHHHHHHHTQQHQQSSNNYGSNNINVHRQNVVTENARIASAGGAAAAATTTCNSVGNTNKTATAAAATTFNYSNDSVDSHATQIVFRSVARRKTDLMPTIPSPRDGHYGSRSSLSHTPRTPGRAFSMSRLDQLAQPIRRNGEHIRAILERERREQMELLDETESLGGGRRRSSKPRHGSGSSSAGAGGGGGAMSRSMTHLAGGRAKYTLSSAGGGVGVGGGSFRPLSGGQRDTTCSRSGNVTPGGNISTSRPGSAMSTSTNMSTSGYVARRSVPATRKQRPASIAGTGMSLEDLNKHKKDNRPPVKGSPSSTTASAQNTPKRTSNLMSTSMIVTSSSRLSSAEKKTPAKRDSVTPKSSTPKSLSKTSSSDRLNRSSKDIMSKSLISPSPSQTLVKSEKDKVTAIEQKKEVPPPPPVQSKEEKNSLNIAKSEAEYTADKTIAATEATVVAPDAVGPLTTDNVETVAPIVKANETKAEQLVDTAPIESKQIDATTVLAAVEQQQVLPAQPQPQPRSQNGSKENSEVRELTPPAQNGDNTDLMSASMIAKNKITTEEEAKAALAERRRLAREEAERQAELERQRLEAERLAELKRQEEEAERQRAFEEEANHLAEEQRRAEEERLRQAIEEAKQKEEEERRRREEEEKQRVQREEAERKAKEEAEKQRLEVAERLKREEKEREERRKRVEAIMSRTRKGAGGSGSATTPNSTPVKESTTPKSTADNLQQETQQDQSYTSNAVTNAVVSGSTDSSSTSGSTTTATTPNPPPQNNAAAVPTAVVTVVSTNVPAALKENINEPQNTQAMYEQAVIDKEAALINSFSNMLIDENAKNLHQQQQHQHQHFQQPTQILEVSNGKLPINSDVLLQNTTTTTTTINTTAVANGNGHHIENLNNKNDINNLQDAVTPAANQLIDLSIESQDINNAVNFNNNNSLLNTTTNATLVTADSHENKDISLL